MMVERWKNLELRSPSLTYNSLEFCRNRKSSLASHLSSSKFRDALRLMNENDKENEKLVKRDGYIYIYIYIYIKWDYYTMRMAKESTTTVSPSGSAQPNLGPKAKDLCGAFLCLY